MGADIRRRSPRSPSGKQRPKIPITLAEDIEALVREDAEKSRVSISFYLSQIIESHYGEKVIDPTILNLIRRVEKLEDIIYSAHDFSSSEYQITEIDLVHLVEIREERDLSFREISDNSGITFETIKGIFKGKIRQISMDDWTRLMDFLN